MYVYIYTYTYIDIYSYIHTSVYIYIHMCIHIYNLLLIILSASYKESSLGAQQRGLMSEPAAHHSCPTSISRVPGHQIVFLFPQELPTHSCRCLRDNALHAFGGKRHFVFPAGRNGCPPTQEWSRWPTRLLCNLFVCEGVNVCECGCVRMCIDIYICIYI